MTAAAVTALQEMLELQTWIGNGLGVTVGGSPVPEARRADQAYLDAISEMARHLARSGDPFYWSPSLVPLLVAAATPDLDGAGWSLETIPSRNGFLWLGRAINPEILGDMETDMGQLKALIWHTMKDDQLICYVLGKSLKTDLEVLGFVGIWYADGRRAGAIEKNPVYTRLFTAAFLFMAQRVVTREKAHPDRAAKKWLPPHMHEKTIEVVTLRRVSPKQPTGEHRDVEWQSQWVVRGHWHKFWVGRMGEQRLEPRWVAPYVKGPEGKPLKRPAFQIFEVRR